MTLSGSALFVSMLTVASGDIDEGRKIFHDPSLGRNGVACTSCHSAVKDEDKEGDGLLRPGHTLFGVARRKYWRVDFKRRAHAELSKAVDVCVQLFQGGEPLQGDRRASLDAFLRSISPAGGHPVIEIRATLEADLDYDRPKYRDGDADRGKRLFYQACHGCHPHGASGLGSTLFKKKWTDVARKLREGNGLLRGARKAGEWMPFFGTDRLSDREVAAIAAFVELLEPPQARGPTP